MKKGVIGLFALLILACATPEQKELVGEIEGAASGVMVVLPGAANWCKSEKECQYERDLKCGAFSDDQCIRGMQLDAVRLGADTLVIQEKAPYHGLPDRTYMYAQAYRCSGKFASLGERYQAIRASKLPHVRYLSQKYAEQCGSVKSCQSQGSAGCDSMEWNPTRICLRQLSLEFPENGTANTLVLKPASYDFYVDNGKYSRGNYHLEGAAYQCQIK